MVTQFRFLSKDLMYTMGRTAGLLGIFSALGTTALVLTYTVTKDVIEANAHTVLTQALRQIVSSDRYDNDIAVDTMEIYDPSLQKSSPVIIYRARKEGTPVAAIFAVTADGYGGNIKMLVGINLDGTISGVRVTAHKETPGLGDKIDIERSPWVTKFTGQSLKKTDPERWTVIKNGGVFDQFSGATITPRAVIEEIKCTLQYYETHRAILFADIPHS